VTAEVTARYQTGLRTGQAGFSRLLADGLLHRPSRHVTGTGNPPRSEEPSGPHGCLVDNAGNAVGA
jgi:hypothetical protein